MKISVPREIKNNEFRVALTPAGVRDLTAVGHHVSIETNAGVGSGITDEAYAEQGAVIVADSDTIWNEADMVVKVKEPIEPEYHYFRQDLLLFTFLHLAAEPELTAALLKSKITAIAYETVQGATGGLPLLAPMSEVAGRLSAIVGAWATWVPVFQAQPRQKWLFWAAGLLAPTQPRSRSGWAPKSPF